MVETEYCRDTTKMDRNEIKKREYGYRALSDDRKGEGPTPFAAISDIAQKAAFPSDNVEMVEYFDEFGNPITGDQLKRYGYSYFVATLYKDEQYYYFDGVVDRKDNGEWEADSAGVEASRL